MSRSPPRFIVLVNGVALPGVSDISVTQANAFQVAKFHFTKAFVQGDPYPVEWWAATASKTIQVEIQVAADGMGFSQVILGNADSHRWDMVANKLSVAGRDMAAALIDTRSLTAYRNLTSSEIAQKLAANHGLQANVTATHTLVGRYYDTDHDQIQSGDFCQGSNEWDLLCQLGSKEGIIPYVAGTTLYFNPPAADPPVFNVYFTRGPGGNPVSNVEGLTVERHMTQARDVIVKVRSWHSRDKKTYSATARTKTKDQSTDTTLQPSVYPIVEPNLNQAQCMAMAQKLALDISQHERNVTIKAPSLMLMDPRYVIQISGTGTDYDMTYYPQTITYQITADGGASTDIQAKFSSPLFVYDEDSGEQIGEQA